LGRLGDPFRCDDLFNFGMNDSEMLVSQAVPEIVAATPTVGAYASGLR
jgi:hypothetical protein